MARTAAAVIDLAVNVLKDEDNVVWTEAELLRYIDEAQYAVCMLRPDAHTETVTLSLVAGAAQNITGRRLLRVHYNTSDRSRVNAVEYDDISRTYPSMHSTDASDTQTLAEDYAYDERDQGTFYVSPPNDGNGEVLLTQAANPSEIAATSDDIDIDDVYVPALSEWCLYRAFGKDDETTPSYGRSTRHLQNFYSMLGKKAPSDLGLTPNFGSVREMKSMPEG